MGDLIDPSPLEFRMNTTVCFVNEPVSSSGFWLGDDPLRTRLPLLMLQLSVLVVCCRAAHSLFRRIGLVEATSQIIVGFLLGPSVAGRITWYRHTFYPERSWMHLITVSQLGYALFMFLVGVKTDLSLLLKSGRKPVAVGVAGIIVPMGLIFLFKHTLRESIPENLTPVIDDVAMKWCMTSFVVVSPTLAELRLLNSAVGRVATSASLLSSFVFSVGLSMCAGVKTGGRVSNRLHGVLIASSQLALALLAVFAIRAVTLWMIKKTPAGRPLHERHFVAVLAMAFGCGTLYEVLGYHASAGMFFAGLALPSGPPLGSTLVRRLEGLVSDLFLPAFLALGGFKTDISAVTDGKQLAYMQLFLGLTALGKFAGVMAPALYSGMHLREAFSLALVMNVRGIREVEVLNMWQDRGIARKQTYAVGVVFVVASSAIVTPLLKLVYRPSATYAVSDGRTVQHSGEDAELQVLACVHGEEDVAPIADVLQALRPAAAAAGEAANSLGRPIRIYILHLVQLVGRAAAVLAPHRKFKSPGADRGADLTDHIVQAFRHIEQASHAAVHPFVSICPYASMHLDICALAMEKNAAIVILPFHKRMAIHGAMEVAHAAHREVNVSVLSYAPCSVGILVSPRPSKGPASTVVVPSRYDARLSVAVYFLGGPDDREALCLAACMAANPSVCLTLVRFQLPAGSAGVVDAAEERLDDEVVTEFLQGNAANARVAHREAVVQDGEEMVGLIRNFGDEFNVVILGRRLGMESPMTAGMAQWSEYPELGVLGDMIASTDMGCRAATLVVQQSRVRARQVATSAAAGV